MMRSQARWWTEKLLFVCCAGSLGCGVHMDLLAGGSFGVAGSDEVARFFHRASLLSDGRVLVSGGMTVRAVPASLISLDELSFLDPEAGEFRREFTPLNGAGVVRPRLHVARSSHTQTTLADGRVLITGGYTGATGTRQGSAVDSVEVFDPWSGAVVLLEPMGRARADHSATLLVDGRVVVAGGGGWQVFDPTNDSWSPEYPLQRTRIAHAAAGLPGGDGNGELVLIVGGSGSGSDTLELLGPDKGVSRLSTARLPIGVDDLAAARLESGRVLIVGGQDLRTGETIDSTFLYDATTDELVSVPPPPKLASGIADHEIAAIGGRAFIFGGESETHGQDTELDYAALYDEQSGNWEPLSRMTQARDDFAAVVLQDGRVALISGGRSFFGIELPTNTAEFFSPP